MGAYSNVSDQTYQLPSAFIGGKYQLRKSAHHSSRKSVKVNKSQIHDETPGQGHQSGGGRLS